MRDVVLKLPATAQEYEEAIDAALSDRDSVWGADRTRLEEMRDALRLL